MPYLKYLSVSDNVKYLCFADMAFSSLSVQAPQYSYILNHSILNGKWAQKGSGSNLLSNLEKKSYS